MSTPTTTTTALALGEVRGLARDLAGTAWTPRGMSQADVLGAVLAGQELGLGPLQSLRAIHIIEGRPSLSAAAMMALAQREGWRFRWLSASAESAELAVFAPGEGEPCHVERWDLVRAKRAGLVGRGPWVAYPEAMLRARAISSAIRAVCPGVALGLYSPEEVADMGPATAPSARPVAPTATYIDVAAEVVAPAPAPAPVAEPQAPEIDFGVAVALGDLGVSVEDADRWRRIDGKGALVDLHPAHAGRLADWLRGPHGAAWRDAHRDHEAASAEVEP